MYLLIFQVLTITSDLLCPSVALSVDRDILDRSAVQDPTTHAERRNGMKVTGKLNNDVMNLMDKPRCGYPDISHRRRRKRSPKKRWKYNLLRWGVSSFSMKLRPFLQWKAFQMAFGFWSRHAPLRFKYRKKNPDINILFAKGEHGDGYYNAFDGKGQILAHAFAPTSGETHFDDAEPWTLSNDPTQGINLLYVSVHEFGHALGLDHVMDRDAVMSPHTSTKVKFDKLHPHEREQLERLYDRYGYANVLSGKILFNVRKSGQRRHTPNYVRARYAGAPYHSDAVANIPELNRVYFFKGSYVWRVTHHRVDKEFPKLVPFHRKHGAPRAAVTLTSGKRTTIFLFGVTTFWEWNTDQDTASGSTPMLINRFWPDLPHAPDAAIMWEDRYLYFIKDDKYYKINPLKRRTEKGYPKQMPPPWLAPLCPKPRRLKK